MIQPKRNEGTTVAERIYDAAARAEANGRTKLAGAFWRWAKHEHRRALEAATGLERVARAESTPELVGVG